jgi:hypothetical protein
MHDAIYHTTWADVLDCWCLAAEVHSHSSLKDFAKLKPDWAIIQSISKDLVKRYLLQEDFLYCQEDSEANCDARYENQALRKQHSFLYLEFVHAMNHGDIGPVLTLFPARIAIFTATGKHKYAAHMTQFKTNLDHVYPPQLR